MTLITTNTSSNAASSSFTSGIDSTYKLYIFKFIDVNPATDGTDLTFQVNATDGADYNDSAITSTAFSAYQKEDDSGQALGYQTGWDQAQGTAFQLISFRTQNDADSSTSGEMYLFNPSNTTYVKHFYSTMNSMSGEETTQIFVGGYINDTTAIDDIQFKMSSGNMDAVIKLYGVG